jgi:hypothetical protein
VSRRKEVKEELISNRNHGGMNYSLFECDQDWTHTSVGNIVVMNWGLNGLKGSSNVKLLDGLVQVLDSRVSKIIVSKDQLGFLDLVGSVNVLNGESGDRGIITGITEGDTLTRLQGETINVLLRNIEVDRDGPEGAVGKTKVLDNTRKKISSDLLVTECRESFCLPVIILLVQETFKRREASGDDQLEIAKLAVGENNGLDRIGLLEKLLMNGLVADDEIFKNSTVRAVGHVV